MEQFTAVFGEHDTAALLAKLVRDIGYSDPGAVQAAIESADDCCVPSGLRRTVIWSPEQREALAKAAADQIPILVAAARGGDTAAFWVLGLVRDSKVIKECQPQVPGMIRTMMEALESPFEEIILDLFSAALAGDDASTKAAFDLCARTSSLPPTEAIMSEDDLRGLVERYQQQAEAKGLPPLGVEIDDL